MSNKQESIGLLKETNAGIQMGVSTLEEMISDIRDERLRAVMHDSKVEHDELGDEAHRLLLEYGADTKEPHFAAKVMSWMKTNVKMAAEPGDKTAAGLVTDGCNMGVKSLCRYLNQYKAADDASKELTKRLIKIESDFTAEIRQYL